MIPKIIHYCWFGGKPLPKSAIKCISSWKKYLPDYEIKEWNEINFDVNIIAYTAEAYNFKKYAFVSDYARFWILHQYGGIYFDVDVELIKPLSPILDKGSFLGIESLNNVAPGLGFGCNPGLGFLKNMINLYSLLHFDEGGGIMNKKTIVEYTTDELIKHGLICSGDIQYIEGFWIYPPEYFCPINYQSGKLKITKNTYSIHHYDASWHSPKDTIVAFFERHHLSVLNKILSNIKSILKY
ncbi:MAG: glycosyltransferase [Muribaculaceae bacterium]